MRRSIAKGADSVAHRKTRGWLGKTAVAAMTAALFMSLGVSAGNASIRTGTASTQSGTGTLKGIPKSLINQANQEGTLEYYSTFDPTKINAYIHAFNHYFPDIKVQNILLSGGTGLLTRVKAEQSAGEYNADVISANSLVMGQMITGGNLQPFTTSTAVPVPSRLRLPAGYSGVDYAEPIVIAYNPAALAAHGLSVPKSLTDLESPAWKGKFCINTTAVNMYQAYVSFEGHAKARALIDGLGANSPVLTGSDSAAVLSVESGQTYAAATAYGEDAESAYLAAPSELNFVNTNPLPTVAELIDMAKNAPHPAAAKVFLDWVYSRAGQQAGVDVAGLISNRPDVKNHPSKLWNPAVWKPAWTPAVVSSSLYTQLQTEFNKAMNIP